MHVINEQINKLVTGLAYVPFQLFYFLKKKIHEIYIFFNVLKYYSFYVQFLFLFYTLINLY